MLVVSHSDDLLLRELGLVLVLNADALERSQFLLLDALHLKSFVFELLTHLAAFFKVVESVVLHLLRVGGDLGADGGGVVAEVHLLLVLNDALLLLSTLLLLNHTEERVTLKFGLLRKHFFAFQELLLTGDVQVLGLTGSFFSLHNFLGTGSTLTFLEGTLLAECVNLRLSVSSTLLEVTQALDFLLLFFLNLAFFSESTFFTLALFSFITDNFQIFILLFLNLLGLFA